MSITDVARYQFFHVWRRFWGFAAIIVVAIITGVQQLLTRNPPKPAKDWSAVAADYAPFTVLALLFAFVMLVSPFLTARKQLTTQPNLREPITYVFNSENFSGSGPSASWTVAWNVVRMVRETKSLFLVNQDQNIAVVVPKRFFQNAEEVEQWRQLVRGSLLAERIKRPNLIGRWL